MGFHDQQLNVTTPKAYVAGIRKGGGGEIGCALFSRAWNPLPQHPPPHPFSNARLAG